jgi:hypothetical protein
MAYVLTLPSNNPLERPFTESLYMRSCSSFASHASAGTVRRNFPRSVSAASVRSIPSLPNGHLLVTNENTPPRLTSRSLLNLVHEVDGKSSPRRASSHIAQKASWCGSDDPCTALIDDRLPPSPEYVDDDLHDLASQTKITNLDTPDDSLVEATEDGQLELSFRTPCAGQAPQDADTNEDHESQNSGERSIDGLHFKRWLSTLRRRKHHKRKAIIAHEDQNSMADQAVNVTAQGNTKTAHMKSLSLTSSLGLITAVKSASMTVTSASIAPHSRRGTRSGHLRSDHDSSGFSDVRMSFDSKGSADPGMDARAKNRATERRKIVEEMLESEESYISDMKALVNVSIIPSCSMTLR